MTHRIKYLKFDGTLNKVQNVNNTSTFWLKKAIVVKQKRVSTLLFVTENTGAFSDTLPKIPHDYIQYND